jgi:hypothetical protein
VADNQCLTLRYFPPNDQSLYFYSPSLPVLALLRNMRHQNSSLIISDALWSHMVSLFSVSRHSRKPLNPGRPGASFLPHVSLPISMDARSVIKLIVRNVIHPDISHFRKRTRSTTPSKEHPVASTSGQNQSPKPHRLVITRIDAHSSFSPTYLDQNNPGPMPPLLCKSNPSIPHR